MRYLPVASTLSGAKCRIISLSKHTRADHSDGDGSTSMMFIGQGTVILRL